MGSRLSGLSINSEANQLKQELIKIIGEGNNTLAVNLLVTTYNNYLDACEHLETEGKVLMETDYNGNPKTKPNPWVKIQLDSQIQLLKLIQEFGLTPKSKKKLSDKNTPKVNKLSKLIDGLIEQR